MTFKKITYPNFVLARFAVLFTCFVLFWNIASAQDFRIENEIKSPGQKQTSSTVTIFHGNRVYDFIDNNGEITIFDPVNDRFLFVHPRLRLQSVLVASELRDRVDEFRRQESKVRDFSAFIRSPLFETSIDEDSGEMMFNSKWMLYRLETKALEDADIAKRYFDFCDWFCYLNFRTNPGASTPLARLTVNRSLRENNRFPEKLKLTIYPKSNSGLFPANETIECSSKLIFRLRKSDIERIDQLDKSLETYPRVDFSEYQKKVLELGKR